LLGLIALASVAVLHAMGSLLAGALLVIPAATTRMLFDRLLPWQLATIALVLVQGTVGLWLSVELNAPSGATIAVLGGSMFAIGATVLCIGRRGRRSVAVAAVVVGTIALAGCGGSADSASAPKVVGSTTIVSDLIRNVGGDAVDVDQILQPNSDPHDYEPRPADVSAVADAKLVLSSGLGLDEFMDSVVDSSGTKARFVELGDFAHTGNADPHWWQDPHNTKLVVAAIAKELARVAPDEADAIEDRARSYTRKLNTLDAEIENCIGEVAKADRRLVTDHDAFGYYARRYGIRVVGAVIPSMTTQAQPNAGDLSRLSRLVRSEHVKAVFPEQALSHKLADAIARQTGARSDLVLYGDALGPAGSAGETYLKLMATNTEKIVQGLSGGTESCRISPG
jgi:ABC-type Zn uptake system ZnuABC Zn-binding protein ZnuA